MLKWVLIHFIRDLVYWCDKYVGIYRYVHRLITRGMWEVMAALCHSLSLTSCLHHRWQIVSELKMKHVSVAWWCVIDDTSDDWWLTLYTDWIAIPGLWPCAGAGHAGLWVVRGVAVVVDACGVVLPLVQVGGAAALCCVYCSMGWHRWRCALSLCNTTWPSPTFWGHTDLETFILDLDMNFHTLTFTYFLGETDLEMFKIDLDII